MRAPGTDRPSGWRATPELVVGRLTGAGLLVWMGWIHLHLWRDGYRHLPSIGNLFLLNVIVSLLLALALVLVPRRFLAVVAGLGALTALATLGGLLVSIHVGLLGFQEVSNAPFAHLSLWVEGAAFVVLTATALRSLRRSSDVPFVRHT
jgi:hypothetical protein